MARAVRRQSAAARRGKENEYACYRAEEKREHIDFLYNVPERYHSSWDVL